ncbi:hypothetical protein PCL_02528 [Purpureocillium lilacinum]|uniref:Uncharacterized protein n=2 Tax=Purpureocillium lilacinum TaxID=33203 RepID=A0A2U3E0W1_PURLI|nr:hypothetical protein PCL_02528 [Purpureocillium lilacinum]
MGRNGRTPACHSDTAPLRSDAPAPAFILQLRKDERIIVRSTVSKNLNMAVGRTCRTGCPAGSPIRGPCSRCLTRDAWRIAVCYDLRNLGDTLLESFFALAVAMEADAQEDPRQYSADYDEHAGSVREALYARMRRDFDTMRRRAGDGGGTSSWDDDDGDDKGMLLLPNTDLEFGDVVEQMMWAGDHGGGCADMSIMSEGDFVIMFNRLMGHVGERVLRHRQEFLAMLSMAILNIAVVL